MRVSLAAALASAVVLLASTALADDLAVAPSTASVEPGARITFRPIGGSGDYHWSLLDAPSGGTIDERGNYVAGPNADADDIVVLTDPVGTTTQATVHVASGINLAGGANGDNACAVGGAGAAHAGFSAAALALALAFSLTRRRRG